MKLGPVRSGLILAALLAPMALNHQVAQASTVPPKSTLVQIKVKSPEKDFPIRSVWVLTPNVEASEVDTLPVVYMLHGWPGTPQGLISGVRSALDSAFAQGVQPFISVFPDGNALTHSDSEWADSYDGRAMIETWLTTNVINAVEGKNVRNRDNRAILGFSMGGYGAAIIGLHHPNLYGQVITFAGYFVVDDLTNAFGPGPENDKKHLYQTPTSYLKVANKMRWFLGESDFDYTTLIRGQAASWGAKLKSVKASYTLSTNLAGGHSYIFVQSEVPVVTKWLKWNLPYPPVATSPQPTLSPTMTPKPNPTSIM